MNKRMLGLLLPLSQVLTALLLAPVAPLPGADDSASLLCGLFWPPVPLTVPEFA